MTRCAIVPLALEYGMPQNSSEEQKWTHAMFVALPGYPWLPCPICGGIEGCSDTVRERARAAHPGLNLADQREQ